MARIEAATEVLEDFDRFFEHLTTFDAVDVANRLAEILQAVDVLASSPLIGRPVTGGLRELVIGRASRGYVALYRYVAGSGHRVSACRQESARGRVRAGGR